MLSNRAESAVDYVWAVSGAESANIGSVSPDSGRLAPGGDITLTGTISACPAALVISDTEGRGNRHTDELCG